MALTNNRTDAQNSRRWFAFELFLTWATLLFTQGQIVELQYTHTYTHIVIVNEFPEEIGKCS